MEEVGRRKKVGVEEREELGGRAPPAGFEGTSLVADSLVAPDHVAAHAGGAPLRRRRIDCDPHVFNSAVVQHLDLVAVARPVETARRIDRAHADRTLVEHGQLRADRGDMRESTVGFRARNRLAPPAEPQVSAPLDKAEDDEDAEDGVHGVSQEGEPCKGV